MESECILNVELINAHYLTYTYLKHIILFSAFFEKKSVFRHIESSLQNRVQYSVCGIYMEKNDRIFEKCQKWFNAFKIHES